MQEQARHIIGEVVLSCGGDPDPLISDKLRQVADGCVAKAEPPPLLARAGLALAHRIAGVGNALRVVWHTHRGILLK